MDLGNPRLVEADASHDSIKALRRLSKSRARRNVHTLPFSVDKSGRNGEFGKGFLLSFVPRALLLAPCLSPEPWSLRYRGPLQNRGPCKNRGPFGNSSYAVSHLGAYIGASRPCSKDSVHRRVDNASIGSNAKVY